MDSFKPNRKKYSESLGENTKTLVPSIEQPPKMDQKPPLSHLRYAYLGNASTLPVIISASLTAIEEDKLLTVLRDHKNVLRWSLADLKGIRPSMCMHRILLEDGHKPSVEAQRRLNLTGLDPDTLTGFPRWSLLVKSHYTNHREYTMEPHLRKK